MISCIKGKVAGLTEEIATIEVNGLYYELMIPSGLYETLKAALNTDKEISLHTLYFIEAGDRKSYHYPKLIGFTNKVDKEFFQLFTTVSGLGFKKGLKSLTLPVKEIATAIETKSGSTLGRLPGIGPRLAAKVIAELNGKMTKFALSRTNKPLTSSEKKETSLFDEALEVLLQLQYNQVDAEKMIDKAVSDNANIKTVEEMINHIFSHEAAGLKGR